MTTFFLSWWTKRYGIDGLGNGYQVRRNHEWCNLVMEFGRELSDVIGRELGRELGNRMWSDVIGDKKKVMLSCFGGPEVDYLFYMTRVWFCWTRTTGIFVFSPNIKWHSVLNLIDD